MMVGVWSSFAEQVRDIGARIYGQPLSPKVVLGQELAAFLEIAPDYNVAIASANDANRATVATEIDKLKTVRSHFVKKDSYTKCFVVVRGNPSRAIIEEADKLSIVVSSVSSFAALLIEYGKYIDARANAPFGSAVDPQTGEIDKISYVPVTYRNRALGKDYRSADIASMISAGNKIILLGEYGSGKSRCIAEIYDALSSEWGATLSFPFAINLRECWGMQSAEEIIRRHILKIDLDERFGNSAVKAYRQRCGIYLLDGFDELGSQAWSADEEKLKNLRSAALGSGLIGHSQKMTVAARATAEKKTVGQRS